MSEFAEMAQARPICTPCDLDKHSQCDEHLETTPGQWTQCHCIHGNEHDLARAMRAGLLAYESGNEATLRAHAREVARIVASEKPLRINLGVRVAPPKRTA